MRANVQEEDKKTKVVVTKKEPNKQTTPIKNKGGRPLAGESKATEKVAFHIPKEVKDWLETLTDIKARTPNAVIKKIVMQQYELTGKKDD